VVVVPAQIVKFGEGSMEFGEGVPVQGDCALTEVTLVAAFSRSTTAGVNFFMGQF
jgi:hypothetical protein